MAKVRLIEALNRQRHFVWLLLGLAAGAAGPATAGEPDLRIKVACTTEHECSVTLTLANDPSVRPVTTRFRADRLDAHGRWLTAEADGEFDNPEPGVFLLHFRMLEGEDGVIRNAEPGDPEAEILLHEITVAVDDRAHVTFFHGVLHSAQSTKVLRSYLWGYPPGMTRRPE